MKILIFDTETTGLPKRRNANPEETYLFPYVVQLSWMVFNTGNNKLEKLKDKIIRLPKNIRIPPSATEIHGITQERMMMEGEPMDKVLDDFMRDVSSCTYLVAHNIEFDKTMIDVECFRHKFRKKLSECRKMEYCTMKKGIKICNIMKINPYTKKKEPKWPKLIELHKVLFNTDPKNLHNALIDILVCFRCFYKMVYDFDPKETNVQFNQCYEMYCGL